MKALSRWGWHAKTLKVETLWIPLATGAALFIIARQGGDRIAGEKALFLWAEVILPMIGCILAAFGPSSPPGDPCQSLTLTTPSRARTYWERLGLLLGSLFVTGLFVNFLLALTAENSQPFSSALFVSLLSLPILVLFSALAVKTARGLKSSASGAAVSSGTWLLGIILSVLADQPFWQPLYPFLGFFHPSAKIFLCNRLLLLASGLLLLIPEMKIFSAPLVQRGLGGLWTAPLILGLVIGWFHGGAQSFALATATTRNERWRAEVGLLANELAREHANAFHSLSPEVFEQAVDHLTAYIPTSSDSQILVRLMQLTAQIGDAHTQVYLNGVPGLHIVPIQLEWFTEGLFVVGAGADYQHLIGLQVVHLGNAEVDSALAAVGTLFAHANRGRLLQKSPDYLICLEVLNGLGLIPDTRIATFTFQQPDGERLTLALPARSPQEIHDWVTTPVKGQLYRQNTNQPFWWISQPEQKSLYFKYNRCEDRQAFLKMNQSLWEAVEREQPERIIIDLRNNTGGDAQVFAPFLQALAVHPQYYQPNRLYVLIDQSVFSSALINAVQLRQQTAATFIGAPPGDVINHYGEVETFTLPVHRIPIWYATRQFTFEGSQGPFLQPDLPVSVSAQGYFSGRDPLLEAVWAAKIDS